MEESKNSSLKDFNEPFPKNLRGLLDGVNSPLKRKVNQKELAEKAGVSRQVISQYCNGDTSPNVKTLKSIAEFFQVSCDYLVGIVDTPTIDIEDKAIHEKTGLSNIAIENLKQIRYNATPIKERPEFSRSRIEDFIEIYDEQTELEASENYIVEWKDAIKVLNFILTTYDGITFLDDIAMYLFYDFHSMKGKQYSKFGEFFKLKDNKTGREVYFSEDIIKGAISTTITNRLQSWLDKIESNQIKEEKLPAN